MSSPKYKITVEYKEVRNPFEDDDSYHGPNVLDSYTKTVYVDKLPEELKRLIEEDADNYPDNGSYCDY